MSINTCNGLPGYPRHFFVTSRSCASIRGSAVPARLKRGPRIVHFRGHGDEDGLWFESVHGSKHLVSLEWLSAALESTPVDLTILNACWTGGKRILGLRGILARNGAVPAAVGHREPIPDRTAISFAVHLYRGLLGGQTVGQACDEAAKLIAEEGRPGAENIYVSGNRDLVSTADVRPHPETGVVDNGMPSRGYLPPQKLFFGRAPECLQIARALDDSDTNIFSLWGIVIQTHAVKSHFLSRWAGLPRRSPGRLHGSLFIMDTLGPRSKPGYTTSWTGGLCEPRLRCSRSVCPSANNSPPSVSAPSGDLCGTVVARKGCAIADWRFRPRCQASSGSPAAGGGRWLRTSDIFSPT